MVKFTQKDWVNAVKNSEWEVLHHALNIARLKTGNYILDDDGFVATGNYDHQLKNEQILLELSASRLLRARELVNPERLSKDEEFISPP